jgi:hypothetical protein
VHHNKYGTMQPLNILVGGLSEGPASAMLGPWGPIVGPHMGPNYEVTRTHIIPILV